MTHNLCYTCNNSHPRRKHPGKCDFSYTNIPTFVTPSRQSSPRFGSTTQLTSGGSIHLSTSRLRAINQILSYKGALLQRSILTGKPEDVHLLLSSNGISPIIRAKEIHRPMLAMTLGGGNHPTGGLTNGHTGYDVNSIRSLGSIINIGGEYSTNTADAATIMEL